MDRRTLLTSIAGAATASACTRRDDADAGDNHAGRPAPPNRSPASGRWRIRSWQWRANAWRPQIARARLTNGKIQISGAIDAADRAAVIARLRA